MITFPYSIISVLKKFFFNVLLMSFRFFLRFSCFFSTRSTCFRFFYYRKLLFLLREQWIRYYLLNELCNSVTDDQRSVRQIPLLANKCVGRKWELCIHAGEIAVPLTVLVSGQSTCRLLPHNEFEPLNYGYINRAVELKKNFRETTQKSIKTRKKKNFSAKHELCVYALHFTSVKTVCAVPI